MKEFLFTEIRKEASLSGGFYCEIIPVYTAYPEYELMD